MAEIRKQAEDKIYSVSKWLGLNENAEADTRLKAGEASVSLNWKIGRDGALSVRPGTSCLAGLRPGYMARVYNEMETVEGSYSLQLYSLVRVNTCGNLSLSGPVGRYSNDNTPDDPAAAGYIYNGREMAFYYASRFTADGYCRRRVAAIPVDGGVESPAPVRALWRGRVGEKEVMLGACGGRLYRINPDANSRRLLGEVDCSGAVSIFAFGGNAWILDGSELRVYDGSYLSVVGGYRPVVTIGVQAGGGGTSYEQVNKLCADRACWLSPDGSSTVFQLPETDIKAVTAVIDRATGQSYTGSWTSDDYRGTITFSAAPAEGTNTLEVQWTAMQSYRADVTAKRFAELYSGDADARVFLYGDGTNEILYSGIDYQGNARADYWPDMNEIALGVSNTPVTGLIRHYSRLVAFKSDSAYSIADTTITASTDEEIAAFVCLPVNRTVGNIALGQVQLVNNLPISLYGRDLYEWKNASTTNANLTYNETQAKRISDRVSETLKGFDLSSAVTYDDNTNLEYYIVSGDRALVWNYAADVWYGYTDFPARCFCNDGAVLYYGDDTGMVRKVSASCRGDLGKPVRAVWRSGTLGFDAEILKKQSLRLYLAFAPKADSAVHVDVRTDRRESVLSLEAVPNLVRYGSAFDFLSMNFASFSFRTRFMPRLLRLKLKAKKYRYLHIILESDSNRKTASLTGLDLTVRPTVYSTR